MVLTTLIAKYLNSFIQIPGPSTHSFIGRGGKEMKHNDSNRYLPKSSVCDDLPHACNHRLVLKEISKEQSLVMQLRAIVLPALEMNQNSELVSQMFQSILDCSSMVIAELLHCQSDAPAVDMLVDDKETVQRISNDVIEDSARPQHHHQNKRRLLPLTCD